MGRIAAALTRWRWLVLIGWAAGWLVARRHVRGDWHFLEQGALLLTGAHPLSLYADAPSIQVGPLALAVARPLVGANSYVVQAVIYALGLLALRAIELAWPRQDPVRMLIGGLLTIPCWAFVATSGHLDDALVVVCTAAAALSVSRNRAVPAALLTGAAVAAKPWAVVVLPLVLGLTDARVRSLAIAVALPAAAWLPFVLGDRDTVSALSSFRVHVLPISGLQLLGVPTGVSPGWVRPAQMSVGLVAALVVVSLGRWWAVPTAGLAVRVALDPQALGYYAAALAAAVLLADGWSRFRFPAGAFAVFGGLFYPAYLNLQAARHGAVLFTTRATSLPIAGLRVLTCAAAVVLAVALTPAREAPVE